MLILLPGRKYIGYDSKFRMLDPLLKCLVILLFSFFFYEGSIFTLNDNGNYINSEEEASNADGNYQGKSELSEKRPGDKMVL